MCQADIATIEALLKPYQLRVLRLRLAHYDAEVMGRVMRVKPATVHCYLYEARSRLGFDRLDDALRHLQRVGIEPEYLN